MSPPLKADAKFEHLLEYLRQSRGFDFTGYKRPSLLRRVEKRMQAVEIENVVDYVDYLEVRPEEFAVLFNTILINVTSFFRDPPAWKFLAENIVPRITSSKGPKEPIRIWSAGCSSGEEACTIAMIMAEQLGKIDFRRRVKIYATDIDEQALTAARQAMYSAKEIQAVPEELRKKYFDASGDGYSFNMDLRHSLIFGRHDLLLDAPMSRLDLLVCRNTLMYFNAEAQGRILGRFSYALNPNGFLFLGRAEMLLTHSSLFLPVELNCRVFSKASQTGVRDNLLVFGANNGVDSENDAHQQMRLREIAFDTAESAQVVIDINGTLLLANQEARQLFGIDQRDIGRPFHDLELSYRPVELRSLIQQAVLERKVVSVARSERWFKNESSRYLDVHVAPLLDKGTTNGVCITFFDVTRAQQLEDEIQRARQDAETVNEELQATNEELQSTNEELETTNEELQSANEELETTNEELQSTNEELETMNEEMQATNEELQTINDDLRQRTDALNNSRAFLESILSSLRGGVVLVDRNLSVLTWSHMAEELWGLRSDEVKGRSLLHLDFGLPVSQLRNPVRACLAGESDQQEFILDAVNRRGRSIKCRVSISPFKGPNGERQGAIIMTEEMGM
ncbi:MAG TPA: CheR family methyltransferase [Candidatus Binatia bacterium]|nr:CheR family methyltransferase [Candidatus Binatia bacterium]